MTIPNKLTITRILLSPIFFLVFSLSAYFNNHLGIFFTIISWIIFLYGEISDVLDGYLARKLNQVSDLGKIMDPFADVVSRLTYFFCFTLLGIMPAWAFYIILFRELIVTFIRMVLIKSGTAMGASIWGKIKAVVYSISVIIAFISYTFNLDFLSHIIFVFFILSAIAAFFSLADYLIKFTRTDVFKSILQE